MYGTRQFLTSNFLSISLLKVNYGIFRTDKYAWDYAEAVDNSLGSTKCEWPVYHLEQSSKQTLDNSETRIRTVRILILSHGRVKRMGLFFV